MGTRRRSVGRSYSGNGRFSGYSPGQGSDGEDNSPLVENRPERRSYLLSVRPEHSLPTNRLSPSSFGRSNFCAIIAQLTEETQPLFETTLKSFAVSEDADAKFTCIVTGYPQPEVTWYKDDEEMDRYCGLPKYEIFRHGNRHTLQLYKCSEEDAAIYQASACNSKGIVSCSGVLEVGTMTEYKIHQRWFAKLKRKAEAKLREIEQSRKRGKENVELEQLRRVSPDRFQRKRRLTGEIGMHSGTSLWDKEEVAKVRIPDGKPRFNEDVDHAKSKEPLRNALFSNNFINGRLEAEVTTNGDSSIESAEENGEENGNGFLTYIYETVEIMKNKPATKDFSAKKKKKEENATAFPGTNQDISQQADGTQQRRNIVVQKNAGPVTSAERMQSPASNGELMEAEAKEHQSQDVEKPPSYFIPSKADVYFSLKDMYLDIGAKPEVEQKSPEDDADVNWPGVSAPRLEKTVLATGVAQPEDVQNKPYTEQEVERNDAIKTKSAETAGDFSTPLFQSPNWAAEPAKEAQHSLRMGNAAEIPNRSTTETEFQPPSWASENDVGMLSSLSKDDKRESFHTNVRETALLDTLPTDVESALNQPKSPFQNFGSACLQSQEVTEELPPASLGGEQLHPEELGEAPENLKPQQPEGLPTGHEILQPPQMECREESNEEADCLTIWEDAPEEMETKWSKERAPPSPEIQESSMVVSQEGDRYTPPTSESSPAIPFGITQPVEEGNLLLTDDAGRLSTRFGGDEIQHGQAPSLGSAEMVTPGLPAQIISRETRSSDHLDQNAPQTEAVIEEKTEEMLEEQLRDNRPSQKVDLGSEGERTLGVTARSSLQPEVAVEVPIPYPRKRRQAPTARLPQALPESQGPPPLSADSEGLAEQKEPIGQLLKDAKKETGAWQPVRSATSESEQLAHRMAVEKAHVREESQAPLRDEENEQEGLTIGKKLETRARERTVLPQPETAMEEDQAPDKEEHKNLVSSLKNYLLLLLKMTTETDQSKGRTEQAFKAVEERSPLSAIPKHISDVGIAGLTPRTSRKIFERVETNQLFQSAENLLLTPRTSRKITGMINQELRACKENLVMEPETPPLPCVPSIVVGSVSGDPVGLLDLSSEVSSEAPAALPSATPQELASGARRKIYLPKVKQMDEMEGIDPEGQAHPKRDSPTVSPQQSRKNATLLQTPSPAPSPPVERRSPASARRMATLEVPKLYEEPAEESKTVADSSQGLQETLEGTRPEEQIGEPRKANDPFKAPQVIRKIRAEQFSDASGNLKLWCQFFNILSDSKLTWYKDEIPVTTIERSCGDEGQAALAIVQASLKDCGVYQCTIQNEYGTDSTDFLLSPEVMSGFISKEEIEAGEEIEMTPMVFAKGLADSGFWGDKLFGRIMIETMEVGPGFLHKACRSRAIYGLEPVFDSGHTGIIKVRNLIAFGGRSESTLIERNYDITIQECKIQNSSREYCKIFAAEARAVPDFGPVPEIIPLYLIYRPANNIPYATMEEDLPGQFEHYCGRARDGGLAPANTSEVGHKCCTFQHWLYQWTNGNFLVTDLEGVGWKITNVRIATKTKGYQGLKESCCPGLLEHFVASHQCNHYCKLLALKTLEVPQPPTKTKGSRSPVTGRKASSAQSSPQLQKKSLASPQAPRKGSVSPKSARKCSEATEMQPAAKPRAGDNGKAGQLK